MRKQLKKISLIMLLIAGLFSCDKPNPIELIKDSAADDLEVELLSDQVNYSSGYDSTGIVQTIPRHASVISISDIKNTLVENGVPLTLEATYFGLIFFDFSRPIENNTSKLIGYQTRILGNASFNNDSAALVPHIIRYKEAGIIKDTLAGFKHVLRLNRRRGNGNGNRVNFRFNPFIGQPINFDITTAPEITGNLRVTGNPNNNNFGIELLWNSTNGQKVEIIVAGVLKNQNEIFPIYRLSTKDDGFLRIPGNLIRNIPFDRFDSLVFTFMRKYTHRYSGSNLSDNFIAAQSIHNIKINID